MEPYQPPPFQPKATHLPPEPEHREDAPSTVSGRQLLASDTRYISDRVRWVQAKFDSRSRSIFGAYLSWLLRHCQDIQMDSEKSAHISDARKSLARRCKTELIDFNVYEAATNDPRKVRFEIKEEWSMATKRWEMSRIRAHQGHSRRETSVMGRLCCSSRATKKHGPKDAHGRKCADAFDSWDIS